MPEVLLRTFVAAMDRRGLQAAPGGLQEVANMWPQNGYLRVQKARQILPIDANSIDGVSTTAKPLTLQTIGNRLMTKFRGVVWQVHPYSSDSKLKALPVVQREEITGREVFAAIDGDIYMTPETIAHMLSFDYPLTAWGGSAVMGAPTYVSGTNPAIWTLGTPSIGDVPSDLGPNWRVWFGVDDGSGNIQWHSNSVRIKEHKASPLTIKTDDPGVPGGYADRSAYNVYCLVDTAPAGIIKPANAPSAAKAAGGSLANATYKYIFRYTSNRGSAGIVSGESSAVATSASDNTVALTLTIDAKLPWHVTEVDIFRATDDGNGFGPYYLVKTQPVIKVSGGYNVQSSTIAINDTGWANGAVLEEDAFWHELPVNLRSVRSWNGRLWAIDDAKPGRMRYSAHGKPHSWATEKFDVLDMDGAAKYAGDYVDIGAKDEAIQSIIPERGAFSETGNVGDSLLIFKRHSTYRWYGTDGSDFQLYPAFPIGTPNGATCLNAGGVVIFRGPEHWMRVDPGSAPVPFSLPVFPDGLPSTAPKAHAASFGQYVLFTEDYEAGPTYMLDMVTGQIIQVDTGSAWGTYPNDASKLIACLSTNVWHVYFNSATYNTVFRAMTAPLTLAGKSDEMTAVKNVTRIRACFKNTTGAVQTVKFQVFANGERSNGTPVFVMNKSVGYSPGNPYQFAHVGMPTAQPVQGRTIAIDMSGQLTAGSPPNGVTPVFNLEWLALEYTVASPLTEG